MTISNECLYIELPLTGYREAWQLQQKIVRAKTENRLDEDVILALEHTPVFTLGRRGGRDNLCVSEDVLAREGIDVVKVERGGDITYHGPGQLVVYPLLNIQRARIGVADLVTELEDVMIRTADVFGVKAQRNPLNRGVWVGNDKLGSIGLAVRKGVSFHGMALNVNLDLTHFSWINPCGLKNVGMTSLSKVRTQKITVNDAQPEIKKNLEQHLGIEFKPMDAEKLSSLPL